LQQGQIMSFNSQVTNLSTCIYLPGFGISLNALWLVISELEI